MFLSAGALLTFQQNITHNPNWYGNYITNTSCYIVTLQEPLVSKTNSYKALATVNYVSKKDTWQNTTGNVLIYFKKEPGINKLYTYGNQLLIKIPLKPIQNAGNPGGFNYKMYAEMQGITHQLFIDASKITLLKSQEKIWYKQQLFFIRNWVINLIEKYIKNPTEQAVAEALLIGFRDNLERNLVQAYSNTGVVHIIAISGMHLGMIYGLLLWLLAPLKRNKKIAWLQPICILVIIWLFTCVAGAAPSILRSAIMFSTIIIGNLLGSRGNIYNNLATSATILLLINPYSLWDVGFQLSYAAVLSIVIFYKPIVNYFFTANKLLGGIVSILCMSLSAQILTFPIVIFHFHQFPILFLFTNLLAVPVSALILYGEIALLLASPIQFIASFIGKLVERLLWWLNEFIVAINGLPNTVINGIKISIFQTILLLVFIAAVTTFLAQKRKIYLLVAATSLISFSSIRVYDYWIASKQQLIIIYNMPKHAAIDVVSGMEYQFIGDSILLQDGFLRNFHLNPSRVFYRTSLAQQPLATIKQNTIYYNGLSIFILNNLKQKLPNTSLDYCLISGNPPLKIQELFSTIKAPTFIFDGTNQAYKISEWKKACNNLHLRCFSVAENGAYVITLP